MLSLPADLKLEGLSDNELFDKIIKLATAIRETKSMSDRDSYGLKFYRALETELSRRKVIITSHEARFCDSSIDG